MTNDEFRTDELPRRRLERRRLVGNDELERTTTLLIGIFRFAQNDKHEPSGLGRRRLVGNDGVSGERFQR